MFGDDISNEYAGVLHIGSGREFGEAVAAAQQEIVCGDGV
jgi:hypothetical protein